MKRTLRTHEIVEIEPGVFYTVLKPCSAAVLPHVLAPEPSHVWLVEHRPDARLLWAELPVPLTADAPAERLRVRGLVYDLQMPTAEFLASVVPRLAGGAGVTVLQLDRPVPDSLRYAEISGAPGKHAILRRNGWRLTFDLPHAGEYAEVTAPDRGTLERVLDSPAIAAGEAAGELP
jgi:hypothetical protein